MIPSLDKFGPQWRAVRRLTRGQILARLQMRAKQWQLRHSTVERALPRSRHTLSEDWPQRLAALGQPELNGAETSWSSTSGLQFRGNADWLASSSGRNTLHERDLGRLELFYHDFIWEGKLSEIDAWEFVAGYLEDHRERASDSRYEWHPYTVSNRLASWLAFLASATRADRSETRQLLANECLLLTDFVEWMLERDIKANHLLKNLWALALSDSVFSSDRGRIGRSVGAYIDELEEQFLPDGGHYELSPMYHAKALWDARTLLRVISEQSEESARIEEVARRAEGWLNATRMAPRDWANVNDSWNMPNLAGKLWGQGSWSPDPGVVSLESSGFVRGNLGKWRWFFDVGGVSPLTNPGHSHSDTLSIILYSDANPLLVDPGVVHYSPNDERQFLKSCHAHNGPCLRDRDHTEMIGSFRVGRAARAELGGIEEEAGEQRVGAYHFGYEEATVTRMVAVRSKSFEMIDTWAGRGERRFCPWLRLLWNAEVSDLLECAILRDRITLRFPPDASKSSIHVQIETVGMCRPRLVVQNSWFSDRFGQRVPACETVVSAEHIQGVVSAITRVEFA